MKLKKRIMLVVSMAIMTLSVLLSDMQVNAQTQVFDFYFGINYATDGWVYCSTDETVSDNQEFSRMFDLYNTNNAKLNLSSNKYYFIITTGSINLNNVEYVKSSLNTSVRPYGYIALNGEKYYWGESGYCTFVTPGTGYYTIPYFTGVEVQVSPYHSDDGYYYANGVKASFAQSLRLRVFELSFEEVASEKQLYDLNVKLSALNAYMSNSVALQQTYYPKLTEMLLRLSHIDIDLDTLIEQMAYLMTEIDEQGITLDNIEHWTKKDYETLLEVADKIDDLTEELTSSSTSDKQSTNKFESASNNQSGQLNELNQQTQMSKIDVDNVSSSVDANIDDNAILNYGVVLSSITGNGKVVQLMLIVLSIGVVSYVLYGKR